MAAIQNNFKKMMPTTPFKIWVFSLLILMAAGAAAGIYVLINGLEVTNLSDAVPWGLWITQDLSSIGLGAGAFTFSAIVYLFKIERFKPISRVAVFLGFLGYSSAMICLGMDIGRPDRFWHPLVYWNVHSVLWEVTMCVILYSTVLLLEVLPILFELDYFDKWPKLRTFGHKLHKLTPVFALIGMALSMLHQSSLGATYGVLSGRAIWYKPSMPVMFILSAVAGGVALILFTTVVTSNLTNRKLIPQKLKRDIARISGFALAAYLYLKIWDWASVSYYSHTPETANTLARLNAATPYTQSFWWLEIFLGGLIPLVLLFSPRFFKKDSALATGTALIIMGVIVNRWNVTLSGLVAPPQWSPGVLGNTLLTSYTPSLPEVLVSLGVLGFGLLAFSLGVKYLPIYKDFTD
jgi:molybdopterin-containing oxidoreductase family membrane subunit